MKNLRKYGRGPYRVAVLHGGPGAAGAAAPVARELSEITGALEPLQTANSIEGQVAELREVLEKYAALPVVVVGHSWGAMLGYIFTARYPLMVKKLIMVASGPFKPEYAESIPAARLTRLNEEERIEVFRLIDVIEDRVKGQKDEAMSRLVVLFARADTFAALPAEKGREMVKVSEEINRRVWAEVEKMRASGELLRLGRQIRCPVVAIHGDYDTHPAEGVEKPLATVLRDFRFILLEKCGHEPWTEKYARDEFYKILKNEIK